MPQIDFELQDDRELLIVIAQTCNAIDDKLAQLNGTVRQNSERISKLETRAKINCETSKDSKPLIRLITYIGIGAAAIGIAVGVAGKILGW